MGVRSHIGVQNVQKYYLVWIRGGHIRQVGLTTGGLSSQGPLYIVNTALNAVRLVYYRSQWVNVRGLNTPDANCTLHHLKLFRFHAWHEINFEKLLRMHNGERYGQKHLFDLAQCRAERGYQLTVKG